MLRSETFYSAKQHFAAKNESQSSKPMLFIFTQYSERTAQNEPSHESQATNPVSLSYPLILLSSYSPVYLTLRANLTFVIYYTNFASESQEYNPQISQMNADFFRQSNIVKSRQPCPAAAMHRRDELSCLILKY